MSSKHKEQGILYPGVSIVFLCQDEQNNILLNKRGINSRDEVGTWDPGGGALELGVTIEDTLRKEVKEEYCTEILSYEFLGYRDVHRQIILPTEGLENSRNPQLVNTHWIALDFKCLVDKTLVKNGEPHKLDEVEWFTKNSLPTPLHSQFHHFLEKYNEKLWQKVVLKFPDDVPIDHIDKTFLQGMLNRMAMGFYGHGHFRREHNKPNFLECFEIRMRTYKTTGNTEFLMDAANFLMGEFMNPSHPNAHFRATTDEEAPGVVCGGVFSKQAKVHRTVREGD